MRCICMRVDELVSGTEDVIGVDGVFRLLIPLNGGRGHDVREETLTKLTNAVVM